MLGSFFGVLCCYRSWSVSFWKKKCFSVWSSSAWLRQMTCALLRHVPECGALTETDTPLTWALGLAEPPGVFTAVEGAGGNLAMGSGSQTQLWTLPSALHLPSLVTAFPPGRNSETCWRAPHQAAGSEHGLIFVNSSLCRLKGKMTTCTS